MSDVSDEERAASSRRRRHALCLPTFPLQFHTHCLTLSLFSNYPNYFLPIQRLILAVLFLSPPFTPSNRAPLWPITSLHLTPLSLIRTPSPLLRSRQAPPYFPSPPSSMVVEQWTTRRNSYPKLDSSDQVLLEIPPTPPSDARNSLSSSASAASLVTAGIVGSWYASNIGVLLLNKYLLSIYGYRYPIFLTTLHMLSCAAYSSAAVHWLRLVPVQHIHSRRQLLKILSLSVIFCFSVVCGNSSLKYIPVSFNQAIGATTPFFTAIFAFIITCRREAPIVYFSLLPVVLGIVVASHSEPLFHLLGFFLCVGSTAGRALKSVVQGIILTSESEKLNSMNLLMYMAPMAAAILLPFSLYIEGNVAGVTLEKAKGDWFIVFLLIGNATVAYLVNLTNFLVTKHTSALTLQVLGNAKAAVAAAVSVLIFRNPVTVIGITGFGVTIMGVVLYSEAKKRSKLTAH